MLMTLGAVTGSMVAFLPAIVGIPEDCISRLRDLEQLGVRKIWLNVHFEGKIGFMKRWSRDVITEIG